MSTLSSLLLLLHLIGLALGLGAATVKLALLLKCRADPAFVPVYLAVTRPITRHIVLGMILLTLSGIAWLLLGTTLTWRLGGKLFVVGALWVMGPIIDNVVEPRFRQLAPATGQPPSSEFLRAQKRYLSFEATATAMFYVVVVMWVVT